MKKNIKLLIVAAIVVVVIGIMMCISILNGPINDYKETQTINIELMEMDIPKAWEFNDSISNDTNLYYYKHDDGMVSMLYVTVSDLGFIAEDDPVAVDDYYADFFGGFNTTGTVENLSNIHGVTIGGLNGQAADFTSKSNGKEYASQIYVVAYNNRCYQIIFASCINNDSDFDKSINSVSFLPTPEEQAEIEAEAQKDAEIDSASIGEQNALESAQSYLSSQSFSKQGLIEQLEFEGYTHEEAVFGVEHCDANWNEQAASTAQSYLDSVGGFSRQSLAEQLEFEGFSDSEIEYALKQVGY